MTQTLAPLFSEALCAPYTAIAYRFGERLEALFPDRAVVACDPCGFDLDDFLAAGEATAQPVPLLGWNETRTDWTTADGGDDDEEEDDGPREIVLMRSFRNAVRAVVWQGVSLLVVQAKWPSRSYGDDNGLWIVGDTPADAEAFYQAVCAWEAVVRDEVLVFQSGYWSKSRRLRRDIKSARFDNLVLPTSLIAPLREDIRRFFASRDAYRRFGVPWKRGLILAGPPGNGKTHAVKAIINETGLPGLVVRSVAGDSPSEVHRNLGSVFANAAQKAPCILVLEDLETLVTDENRSYFLNALDGMANLSGVLVLATTNYPERLDVAIRCRPSRFDRLYRFDLPARPERAEYLRRWSDTQSVALRLTEEGVASLAASTDGFSFAYLKELCLSATMAWMDAGEDAPMDAVMAAQVALLAEQRASAVG